MVGLNLEWVRSGCPDESGGSGGCPGEHDKLSTTGFPIGGLECLGCRWRVWFMPDVCATRVRKEFAVVDHLVVCSSMKARLLSQFSFKLHTLVDQRVAIQCFTLRDQASELSTSKLNLRSSPLPTP